MKMFIRLLALAMLLAPVPRSTGQDTETAAEVAARQDAEERYKRLSAAIEDLIAAQAAQQKKIVELTESLATLREEMTRNANSNTTREELRSLAEKVQEIEKNREADKKLILDEIKKLGKMPVRPAPAVTTPSARPEKGYEYVIQPGDTLSAVALAYQKEGIKVTIESIQKANPKLDPTKLQVGQKIFIPQP